MDLLYVYYVCIMWLFILSYKKICSILINSYTNVSESVKNWVQ